MNVEIVAEWTEKLAGMGVKILSLSDTIGSSTPDIITYLFSNLIPQYPDIEFGAHLYTTPQAWFEKVDAAYQSDVADLTVPSKDLEVSDGKDNLSICRPKKCSVILTNKIETGINSLAFESAYNKALDILWFIFKCFHKI